MRRGHGGRCEPYRYMLKMHFSALSPQQQQRTPPPPPMLRRRKHAEDSDESGNSEPKAPPSSPTELEDLPKLMPMPQTWPPPAPILQPLLLPATAILLPFILPVNWVSWLP